MKKLSLDEIKAMPAADLVDGLRHLRFSLLQSMGFHKLRAEMNATGLVCRAIIALTGLRKEAKPEPHEANLQSKGRKRVGKILSKAAPYELYGNFPHPDGGLVLGFNHPSLGEILRFICICVKEYPGKVNLFPVNLPWYEAIMPIVNDLEKIGIYVMPVITPSTKRKMAKKADANTMAVVEDLSTALNALYMKKCAEFAKNKDNIWVAPTATRQRTVFKTVGCSNGTIGIEPQTMTFLAVALRRDRVADCLFQVVGVLPPANFGRGLNLFKLYKIKIGEIITMETANKELRETMDNCPGSKFEFDFLSKIARAVYGLGGSDIIAPESAQE